MKYNRNISEKFTYELVTVKDLSIGDTIYIEDPFCEQVNFPLKKWEISGDYCLFNVVGIVEKCMVLKPTNDMVFRDESFRDEYLISIKVDSTNIIRILEKR